MQKAACEVCAQVQHQATRGHHSQRGDSKAEGSKQVGQEAQLLLCLAHLSIPRLLPCPAWHLICGQRILGALEPTQAFQGFNSTALTRLRAWCGTVLWVWLKGTSRLLLYRAVFPRLLPAQCSLCTLLKSIILYPSMDSKPSSVTTGSQSLCGTFMLVSVCMVGAVCVCVSHSSWIYDFLCTYKVHIKGTRE